MKKKIVQRDNFLEYARGLWLDQFIRVDKYWRVSPNNSRKQVSSNQIHSFIFRANVNHYPADDIDIAPILVRISPIILLSRISFSIWCMPHDGVFFNWKTSKQSFVVPYKDERESALINISTICNVCEVFDKTNSLDFSWRRWMKERLFDIMICFY